MTFEETGTSEKPSQNEIPWEKLKTYDELVFDNLKKEVTYEVFNKPGSTSLIARFSNFILNHIEKKYKRSTAEMKRKVVKEAGDNYPRSLKRLLPSGDLRHLL